MFDARMGPRGSPKRYFGVALTMHKYNYRLLQYKLMSSRNFWLSFWYFETWACGDWPSWRRTLGWTWVTELLCESSPWLTQQSVSLSEPRAQCLFIVLKAKPSSSKLGKWMLGVTPRFSLHYLFLFLETGHPWLLWTLQQKKAGKKMTSNTFHQSLPSVARCLFCLCQSQLRAHSWRTRLSLTRVLLMLPPTRSLVPLMVPSPQASWACQVQSMAILAHLVLSWTITLTTIQV